MPLSRAYRPQRFSDVTGQQHVTETLRREVEKDLIGHAYLFSGPRGVGKTTSARIFAKALLCEKPKEGEPCNDCDACREVTTGNCIDLIEMDAASNTGVDNVREAVIEHVRFSPARWKRKIYVIDEAHMLSTSAWNALLKTLEEPPSYAVFILATTELHKVPATIISRCQRFEFKRISPEDMTARIQFVAKEEGLKPDAEVVAAIVRAADGYLRDAESLLEQLASLGEKKITVELAELVLPASRLPDAARILGICADRDVSGALSALRELLENGASPMPLFDDLLAVTRLLIRSSDPSEAKRLADGDAAQKAVHALVGRYAMAELSEIALLLIERRRDAKSGVDAVFALELAVTGICVRGSGSGPSSHGAARSADTKGQSSPREAAPAATGTGPALSAPDRSAGVSESNRAPVPAPASTASPSEDVAMKMVEAVVAPAAAQTFSASATTGTLELHDVLIRWREVIRLVEVENRSLPFVLKITQPESIRGSAVVLRFQYPFHCEKIINDLKSKRIVESALRQAMGRDDLLIEGVVGETIGEADRPQTRDIVAKVLNAFGGTVVE